jgi:uncharacterized cupin superfamily protein
MMRAVAGLVALLILSAMPQAQDAPKIVRFEPNGPAGRAWSNGEGRHKKHHYYRSLLNNRVAAGIWASPDFSGQMRRQPFSEFIYLLSGSITLADKSGREETFKAGDAVMIPRGTEFQWKRSDHVKEYWVIFEREDGPGQLPAVAGAPTFYRLGADGPADKGLTGEGRTRQHQYYAGADGSSVGVWETAPFTSPAFRRTTYTELMVFLKGNVTLSTPDGQTHQFKAGDVALVPKGIDYKWSSDTLRKFWVIFDKDTKSTN